MDQNNVPYFPGAKGPDAILEMVKAMMDPAQDHRYCLFCAAHNTSGLVGVASFSGDQAALMGARPGKERAAVYFVCTDCASKYPTLEEMNEACDAHLVQQAVALNQETPH